MDYSFTAFILLLPLLSFLVLGLAGMKMSHKTAGLIGTTSLGVVTVLSYFTAFSYFSAPRLADGTFATIVPYISPGCRSINFTSTSVSCSTPSRS